MGHVYMEDPAAYSQMPTRSSLSNWSLKSSSHRSKNIRCPHSPGRTEEIRPIAGLVAAPSWTEVEAKCHSCIYRGQKKGAKQHFFSWKGYGYTTPLSDTGKAFCIFYALIGVPFTMLVLTAAIQRLMAIVTHKPIQYFQMHRGYDHKAVTKCHFVVLLIVVFTFFLLVPSAIFNAIENTWSFLDAFYFCFISLCTIGLGDYVPGEQSDQFLRQLYKVSVAFYLFLGLLSMLLVLQTFHKAADLHGLTDLLFLPHLAEQEDQEPILETTNSISTDPEPKRPLAFNSQPGYESINR